VLRLDPRLRPDELLVLPLRLALPRGEPDRLVVVVASGATLRVGSESSETTTVMWLVRLLIR